MTVRTLIVSCGLAALVPLSGCALSINPVVSESEATFDPRLLGTWEDSSGSNRAFVTRATGNSYAIEYASDGRVGMFGARLGRLGERFILDVWPAPRDGDIPAPYEGLTIAGHLLLILDIGPDELRVTTLNPDSLLGALRSDQVRLGYERSERQFILHGTTEELRSALGPYLARSAVLPGREEWRRGRRSAASSVASRVDVPCFEVSAWREADRLFHRDSHWLGADVASSVDLGGGRILWLFGDTWIDPSGRGTRKGACMVSNSVAIQNGTDPSRAAISFYWTRGPDGKPDAMFPDRGGESLWFGNGVRVRDRLVLFFARTVRNTGTGLGFESTGWTAVLVENPDTDPSSWRTRTLQTPANPLGILVGFAGVIMQGQYVVALGSENPVKSHPIYAVRWPAEEVRRGNLLHPEWWAGGLSGWVGDSSSTQRWPLFENGQSELSIHVDQTGGRFLVVHTQGFGPADIMMRAAPTLTGPWSAPQQVYRPPEYYRPNVMIYAGKAHPELTGADLVLTYASNTFQFAEQLTDSLIYYPRFVRLTRCQ